MATPSLKNQEDKNLKRIVDKLKKITSAMKPVNNEELTESIEQCYKELSELETHLTDTSQIIYDWHDYFMCIACLAALRSADPKTKVGACIVNQNNNVVGIGYNCMPGDYDDHKYPKDGRNPNDKFSDALFDCNKKYLYVVHAAVNAILNKTVASLEGCTIYLTMSVDEDCAHAIIQSGIKTVIYSDFDKNPYRLEQRRQDIKNGRELLNKAGITVVPYESLNEPKVTLTNGKTICLSDILQQNQQKNEDQPQKTDEEQPQNTNKDQLQSLTPDQFFMAIAMLSQKKQGHHEHDPHSTQGACIVSECGKKVISIGHSGYPDQVNPKINCERYLPGDPFSK
jgi:dCMP deaminase